MKTELLKEFIVDKANKSVHVIREFDADQALVWEAFTTAEILDQWWAPKPFSSKTKHMNFEVGGRRFYAMITPEGEARWALQRYLSITPISNFKFYNTFADENENPDLPGSEWNLDFSEENGRTKVNITITNESLERMEKMIEMGFQIGFTMTLDYLGTLVQTLKTK